MEQGYCQSIAMAVAISLYYQEMESNLTSEVGFIKLVELLAIYVGDSTLCLKQPKSQPLASNTLP